jgi:hypothetical protein
MAIQKGDIWQKVIRIGYPAVLVLASVPWYLSGLKTPILCAVVAAFVGMSIASLPDAGFRIALAVAAVMLGLLGVALLTYGPDMGPLQVGGMPLSGIRYALPIGHIAAYLGKGTASEKSHESTSVDGAVTL